MPEGTRRKVTIPMLMKRMRDSEAITQMAVYDYRTAVVSDRLGMDILCVSDTGGMILFGHKSTVTVSFEEVMMMAQGRRPRQPTTACAWSTCPIGAFISRQTRPVENAGRFVHEANAEVMKCEGNQHHARNIEAIVKAGIPVQGHIGHHADAHAANRRLRRPRQDGRAGQANGRRRDILRRCRLHSRFSAKSPPKTSANT